KIEHFISRKAMDIDGLGEETIDLLYKNSLISKSADLYSLKKEDIVDLDRMGLKSAENIINSIKTSKDRDLSRLLFGLGIRYVGETVAKTLAEHFRTMDKLIQAEKDELESIFEIGERIAESLISYFREDKNLRHIDRLKEAGLNMESTSSALQSDSLSGLTIVISGKFYKHSREEYKALIKTHGGRNASSISQGTSYILGGENIGPAKLKKAEDLKIKIINEEEFLLLIN
ncbi:MAG: helix-hairpin-helix domain-containing protein, partial [Bacteroidales bacterium]|nr:helix-hairpin-helix domain-containing protein [Bacteroidales bacterium]